MREMMLIARQCTSTGVTVSAGGFSNSHSATLAEQICFLDSASSSTLTDRATDELIPRLPAPTPETERLPHRLHWRRLHHARLPPGRLPASRLQPGRDRLAQAR